MSLILVVDDSRVDRVMVEELLGEAEGLSVASVADGPSALECIATQPVEIVVTDIVMPGMDGFEVVAAVRERFPQVPVILMTSKGSEEVAVRALREGAASYVPKDMLATTLLETVRDVLVLSRKERDERRVLETVRRTEYEFCLDNDDSLLRPLVIHLQEVVLQMGLCDETECTQVGIALYEALSNAVVHGNLETSSQLRYEDFGAYFEAVRERRRQEPYCRRRVFVEARFDREEARFLIRDQGPGFDPSTLPDPREPANLQNVSGRGILLMRTFMDEVLFDERGNQVTMVKRRRA